LQRPVAIIEAPSILGLWPSGVERLPDALRAAGLHRRLGIGDDETSAARLTRLVPPTFDATRDPATGLLNGPGLAAFSRQLAEAVGGAVDRGEFPLVLGGDCSVLLGALLALRRRDGCGLFFVDGHADYYQPSAEPKGEVASMDLALATGRGPALLSDLDGLRPLVRDVDVVAFAYRDTDEARAHGSDDITATAIHAMPLDDVRRLGIATATAHAVAHLTRAYGPGLFWLHFDTDVLDDAVMPAVDYRQPGGLSTDEAKSVLSTALTTGRCVGMTITIFNPSLDPDGAIARRLVELLAGSIDASRIEPEQVV
jgi:arginase